MSSLKTKTVQIIRNLPWSSVRTGATFVLYARRLSKRYDAFRQNRPLLMETRIQALPWLAVNWFTLSPFVCRQISWGHTCPFIQTRRTSGVTFVRLRSEPKALWFATTDGTRVHRGLLLYMTFSDCFCTILSHHKMIPLKYLKATLLWFFRWAALPVQSVWPLLQRVRCADETPEIADAVYREDPLQPVQRDPLQQGWCLQRLKKITLQLHLVWILTHGHVLLFCDAFGKSKSSIFCGTDWLLHWCVVLCCAVLQKYSSLLCSLTKSSSCLWSV